MHPPLALGRPANAGQVKYLLWTTGHGHLGLATEFWRSPRDGGRVCSPHTPVWHRYACVSDFLSVASVESVREMMEWGSSFVEQLDEAGKLSALDVLRRE